MPLWCRCSFLTLTDHCPAAQSSPAASPGCHLTALCPTAHCPHSSAAVPSSPPQPQCQGHPLHALLCSPLPSSHKPAFSPPSLALQQPHCLPHPNPTALHAHSTGSSVSAPPHPKFPPFPTSLAMLVANCPQHLPRHPLDTEPHFAPLCRAAPQCLLRATAGGLEVTQLWHGPSCTPSLSLPYPCVLTLHLCMAQATESAAAAWGALGGHWMNWGCDQQNLVLFCAGSVSPSPGFCTCPGG